MLTPAETRLLQFEEAHPRRTGLKTDLIISDLKMSPAIYWQTLYRLVRRQDVVAEFPMLAHRIERLSRRRVTEREALKRMVG